MVCSALKQLKQLPKEQAAPAPSCKETIISVIRGCAKKTDKLCLFSTYDAHSVVDPYVTFHLDAIVQAGFDIVLISTSPKLRRRDIRALSNKCLFVVHRANVGLDFASWKVGLEMTDWCAGHSRLLLVNDSIFGPFSDLNKVFDMFESSDAAFCGMTESFQQKHHLQSYFLYVKLDAIPDTVWRSFWNDVQPLRDKAQIITRYEVGLSQYMLSQGVELLPYVKSEDINSTARALGETFQYADRLEKDAVNSTLLMWDLLLQCFDFPYLKRQLFASNPFDSRSLPAWRGIVPERARLTLVPLIDRYLKRTIPPRRPLVASIRRLSRRLLRMFSLSN